MESAAFILPIAGLFSGVILGFFARKNYFCTLSSLEQHWYGGNSSGLRTWALATVVAIILTQFLVQTGIFDPAQSFYLTPNFNWLSAVLGGLAFGFGMALVGTCGYGALVRLGGGSLKSLMAVLVIGLTALSTQTGLLAFARSELNSFGQIDFSSAGDQSLPTIATSITGFDMSLPVTLAIVAIMLGWILKDPGYRKNQSAMMTATIIGSVITFGWFITGYMAETSFDEVQVESASFVAPISDTIMQFGVFTGSGPDYGIGLIIGVVLGSAIASMKADNVMWEACDDARELSRHILGASLMGFGGVMALGCTIGQGISAASLLSISVPITMGSIFIGARLGLTWLLEGSVKAAFRFG